MNQKKEIMKDTFELLRKNFKLNITKSYQWRRDNLITLKRLILDNKQFLEEAKYNDMKIDTYQTFTSEITTSIIMINHALSHLSQWMKSQTCDTPLIMFPSKIVRKYEPLGVTLIIGSWNYPFFTTFMPLITAISAGNPCILKPSEGSPFSSKIIKEIMDQMDQDYFACFEGDKDVGVFLNQQAFDHIVFTGGSKTAQYILKDAAPNLAKVTLELGGQNHTIIDQSANLERAAKSIGTFKFANCGQTCITSNHLFIHKSQTQEFIKLLKNNMQYYYGKDSFENKNFGRICNVYLTKVFADKLKELQNSIIYQQGDINVEERFVPPTLLLNPSWDSQLMQDEIFGPILPIFEYEDINWVISKINECPRGLTMSYFGDLTTPMYQQLKQETDSGSLLANEQGFCGVSFTTGFGGVGYSGQGKIDGFDGFKQFSYDRVLIERPKNILKCLDLEDRYQEVNNSSRKTWEFVSCNLGHRTIEDITSELSTCFGLEN